VKERAIGDGEGGLAKCQMAMPPGGKKNLCHAIRHVVVGAPAIWGALKSDGDGGLLH